MSSVTKKHQKFFCAFPVFCKIVTFPSGTTTFSSSFSETSLKCFHVMSVTNYRAQNVLWMITNKRNTIFKKIFLRKFSSVVTARFHSRNLATYCAISGANTSQAVVFVFFCPTYFGEFKALTDLQELYQNDMSSSTANVDFSDLLDFKTEALNLKFRIQRLNLNDSCVLEPLTTLFSCRKKLFLLWTRYWEKRWI